MAKYSISAILFWPFILLTIWNFVSVFGREGVSICFVWSGIKLPISMKYDFYDFFKLSWEILAEKHCQIVSKKLQELWIDKNFHFTSLVFLWQNVNFSRLFCSFSEKLIILLKEMRISNSISSLGAKKPCRCVKFHAFCEQMVNQSYHVVQHYFAINTHIIMMSKLPFLQKQSKIVINKKIEFYTDKPSQNFITQAFIQYQKHPFYHDGQ